MCVAKPASLSARRMTAAGAATSGLPCRLSNSSTMSLADPAAGYDDGLRLGAVRLQRQVEPAGGVGIAYLPFADKLLRAGPGHAETGPFEALGQRGKLVNGVVRGSVEAGVLQPGAGLEAPPLEIEEQEDRIAIGGDEEGAELPRIDAVMAGEKRSSPSSCLDSSRARTAASRAWYSSELNQFSFTSATSASASSERYTSSRYWALRRACRSVRPRGCRRPR